MPCDERATLVQPADTPTHGVAAGVSTARDDDWDVRHLAAKICWPGFVQGAAAPVVQVRPGVLLIERLVVRVEAHGHAIAALAWPDAPLPHRCPRRVRPRAASVENAPRTTELDDLWAVLADEVLLVGVDRAAELASFALLRGRRSGGLVAPDSLADSLPARVGGSAQDLPVFVRHVELDRDLDPLDPLHLADLLVDQRDGRRLIDPCCQHDGLEFTLEAILAVQARVQILASALLEGDRQLDALATTDLLFRSVDLGAQIVRVKREPDTNLASETTRCSHQKSSSSSACTGFRLSTYSSLTLRHQVRGQNQGTSGATP